jgi:hypothetical protein
MQGLGKHHSTTHEQRVLGHSLVVGLYVLLERQCPLAPRLYRQQAVCEKEEVPFQSKIDLMETLIRTFEPVAGTVTHVLLDSWYGAKVLWKAARERGFLITTGLGSNRWLRVEDPTTAQGWRWQKLSDYTAHLSQSDYMRVKRPKGEEEVDVHVVTTSVRKLYRWKARDRPAVAGRASLASAVLGEKSTWMLILRPCSPISRRAGRLRSSSGMAKKNWVWITINS